MATLFLKPPIAKPDMTHHIRKHQGVWQVWWAPDNVKHIASRELAATSPYSMMDAWNKAMDWHSMKAGEAYREMRRIQNEAP